MAYELEGTIKEIYETKVLGSKGFQKREFVVTVSNGPEDKWPQHIKLGVVKDKCTVLDHFSIGQRVKCSFDVRGSEWQGKYFVDLQAFRIEELGRGAGGGGEQAPRGYEETYDGGGYGFSGAGGGGAAGGDDLPF